MNWVMNMTWLYSIIYSGYDDIIMTGNMMETFAREEFGDKVYLDIELPKITRERVEESRRICSNNRCGNYNTSWTCPPNTGDIDACIARLESYDRAMLVYDSFEVESMEMEHLNCRISDMQDRCRKVLMKAREADLDVFVMCTGPCNHCKVCAFKKGIDCVCPDMCIPSVSGYGIPVRSMLEDIGHESKYTDHSIELFGLILY